MAAPLTNYHINASHLMQVSSVLSNLKLQSGCVHLSILDALRMRTLYDRVDAAGFDWQQASEVVQKQDQLTIGVNELSVQDQASSYLQDQLNKIMKDTQCAHGSASPLRTIIVVSREQRFPVDTKIQRTVPQNPDDTRFFYFRIGRISYASDSLFEMLKPEKPRRFDIRDAGDLRKALSKLISDLEELR